jgi:hypothetical protein
MRELLHLIAYTDDNPLLSDIGLHLNKRCGDNRGFHAECYSSDKICSCSLRDFFGGRVSADKLVNMGSDKYELRFILPPIPLGGFFDDFNVCGVDLCDNEDEYIFVEVVRGEDGGVNVIAQGKLECGNALHESIIGQLLSEKMMKPKRRRVYLPDLYETALYDLRDIPVDRVSEPYDKFCEISRALEELNCEPVTRFQDTLLSWFKPYWHLFCFDEWRRRLVSAHDAVIDEYTPDDSVSGLWASLMRG